MSRISSIVKLVKQVMHGTASGSLLAQAYLSTVLLFAGLYTLEYRFDVGDSDRPIQ